MTLPAGAVLQAISPASVGSGALFQLLRDGRPRTRAELVESTGLARSTIVSRVTALTESGLVAPAEGAASSGGRPPSRIAYNPSSRLIIAADLGATHGLVGVTDLDGNPLARSTRRLAIADGPLPILAWVLTEAERLLDGLGRSSRDVIGVGVGVPGPVEHSTGRPVRPPIMPGWDGFDIPEFLQRTFDVPVLVDNDVNILALGERAAVWPQVDDLLFVKIATGIGAGIIAGGVLQRGAQGAAGDLGHVQVPHSGDDLDLEATASAPAVAENIRTNGGEVGEAFELIDMVRHGDAVAVQAVREAGRAVGEVIATCVSLLNPSTIVIGGRLGASTGEIIAGVREVVYRRSIPLSTQHLNIVQAKGGENAGIRGAALMVSQVVLSPEYIDSLVAQARAS